MHNYFGSSQKKDWWERTLKAEYIPVLAKNDSNLLEFLRHNRILEVSARSHKMSAYITAFYICFI